MAQSATGSVKRAVSPIIIDITELPAKRRQTNDRVPQAITIDDDDIPVIPPAKDLNSLDGVMRSILEHEAIVFDSKEDGLLRKPAVAQKVAPPLVSTPPTVLVQDATPGTNSPVDLAAMRTRAALPQTAMPAAPILDKPSAPQVPPAPVSAPTALAIPAAPAVPATTVPTTTVPATTVPATTVPDTTVPAATVPDTAVRTTAVSAPASITAAPHLDPPTQTQLATAMPVLPPQRTVVATVHSVEAPRSLATTATTTVAAAITTGNSDAERAIRNGILDVFPRLQRDILDYLVKKYATRADGLALAVAAAVEYQESSATAVQRPPPASVPAPAPARPTVDFMDKKVTSARGYLTEQYHILCQMQLRHVDFPSYPTAIIGRVLSDNGGRYAQSWRSLRELKDVRLNATKRTRKMVEAASDSEFAAELAFVKDYIHMEQLRKQEQEDASLALQLNDKEYEQSGEKIPCGCCFGEFAFEALSQCQEGCLYCYDCIRSYAENAIFGAGKTRLQCMNTTDACPGVFPPAVLRKVLSEKLWDKYQERLQEESLVACASELNIVRCHGCSAGFELDPQMSELVCPSCSKRTCRQCGKESHPNLACNQVEKAESMRLSIEEEMTKALLRTCHNCKVEFYKTEGCNKMICRCGAIQCYICRADITKEGYTHFCQTPHCNHKKCKKCILHTNSVDEDLRAVAEAAKRKQTEFQRQHMELTDVDIVGKLQPAAARPLPPPRAPHAPPHPPPNVHPQQYQLILQRLEELQQQRLEELQQMAANAAAGGRRRRR